jgi:lipopolysaccharide biosynthesis glycosyltransferase
MTEILICFNDKFTFPAKIWLYNLVKVTPPEVLPELTINIGYIPSELSNENINELQALLACLNLKNQLLPIDTTSDLANFIREQGLIATPLSRLYFVCNWDKPFIYMDIDTLPLPGWHDLIQEIVKLDKVAKPMAAVLDQLVQRHLYDRGNLPGHFLLQEGKELADRYGRYFNSGVFVFNPKYAPSLNFNDVIKLWIHLRNQGSAFFDQDVLNYLFSEEVVPLSSDYNFFVTDPFMWEASERISGLRPPKIIHFVGPKPWNQQGSWKQEFINTLMDDSCANPYRVAHLRYHQLVYEFRVYSKLHLASNELFRNAKI